MERRHYTEFLAFALLSMFCVTLCQESFEMSCPDGFIYFNGGCKARCPNGTFPTDDSCVQCPQDTIYAGGRCVFCEGGMVHKDGRCSCPGDRALLNGKCVIVDIIKCNENEIFINGRCVPQYCYGRSCCNDTLCNQCFETCNQIYNETRTVSLCQSGCINGTMPSVPPSTPVGSQGLPIVCPGTCGQPSWCPNANYQCPQYQQPQVQYVPQPQVQYVPQPQIQAPPPPKIITIPSPSYEQYVHYTNPSGGGQIINITNIVNDTNVKNVITNLNNSNVNEITLDSGSSGLRVVSTSGNNTEQASLLKGVEEACCIITEPRKCEEVNGRARCYHRRRHVCGEECRYPSAEDLDGRYPAYRTDPRPAYHPGQQGVPVRRNWYSF